MSEKRAYTTEDIAKILQVSKLTVYDLIKKGEIPAYRVGRQMRIDPDDLERYIQQSKGTSTTVSDHESPPSLKKDQSIAESATSNRQVVISGQDMCLDILANHLEKRTSFRTLRSHHGSLDSLIAMYQGNADIVSTHLMDGETGEYNIPYIKKLLGGYPIIVVNFLSRKAGFYVEKGNPKSIKKWQDLVKSNVKMVNREIGSGARVLLDECLRKYHIKQDAIKGYDNVESNHISVASAVLNKEADVGVGIEKAASMVKEIDFIPLVREQYDLVMVKKPANEHLINSVMELLTSSDFKKELEAISGYDFSKTGTVLYESF